jgi:hypothetical protein
MSEPTYRNGPNGQRYRQLVSVDDVDQSVLDAAESVLDGWFADQERIDWEEFIDRLEKYLPDNYEIPEYDNPAVRKIQRHIRQLRAQS